MIVSWILAGLAVIGAIVSVYFGLNSQFAWWVADGQLERARRLDRFLRRINPLRRD